MYQFHEPPGRSQQHAAGHVSVDRKWQLSGLAKPFNQLLSAVDGKGSLALGQEHEVRVRMLAP